MGIKRPDESDENLYASVNRFVTQKSIRLQLARFGVDDEDAANEIWIRLCKYARDNTIRNMDAYVNHWGQQQVSRLIDRAAKHRRNRLQENLV